MDLFTQNSTLTPIPIQDGSLFFIKNLHLPYSTHQIFKALEKETPWRSESINIWGKTYLQPRLIAWYGDPGKSYKYSGNNFEPMPWTNLLLAIKSQVEKVCNKSFNSVLLNYYRNGDDSMGFHSDDEPELGKYPSIASLSLGETRTFVLKHKLNKKLKPIKIDLNDGELLLMEGELQEKWSHGIPKEPKKFGSRINLTFRYIN